jgi:hypothetical protein
MYTHMAVAELTRHVCHYLQVYRPIEGLLVVAAFATLVENFAPSLIAIPKVYL